MGWWLGLIACTVSDDPSGATTDGLPTATTLALPARTLTLETRDGVELAADAREVEGATVGVILLHMVPPQWDRTSWPASFQDALQARGWSVLAIDRRGAGASGGVAEEAYLGPKGKYDVEAAALWLAERGTEQLVVIGASNGSTSLLDYAVWAPGEGLPPLALGAMMTGGTYTENNEVMESLPPVPMVYTFSAAEASWSDAQRALDPGSWSFLEYPMDGHGTLLFDTAPSLEADLVDALAERVGG
jgi:pimeloyl-ACP methyl ester carboxylesterase